MTAAGPPDAGELPASQPFSALVGAELKPGLVVLTVPLRAELGQQHGFAHGGVLSYLVDNAPAFAGGSVLGGCAHGRVQDQRPPSRGRRGAGGAGAGAARRQPPGRVRCDVLARGPDGETLCATALGTIIRVQGGRRGDGGG